MNRKERIEKILQTELKPEFLEVKNNSHLHSGHSGDNGSGESHFVISISSLELKNLTRIAAHRKINQLLKNEFEKGHQALEIRYGK